MITKKRVTKIVKSVKPMKKSKAKVYKIVIRK